MKSIKLTESLLNVQKCLLPQSSFLKRHHGKFCLIGSAQTGGPEFLVKIGLFDIKNIENICFYDDCVSSHGFAAGSVNFDIDLSHRLTSINFRGITVLQKPVTAKKINVVVVFSDVFNAEKFLQKPKELISTLRNLLKIIVVCNGSLVKLTSFCEHRNAGISFLMITGSDLRDSKQPFETDSCTEIYVEKCLTQVMFERWHTRRNALKIAGYDLARKMLLEAVRCLRIGLKKMKTTKKILLIGPRGCGKATLVNNVAFDCDGILIEISTEINFREKSKELIDSALKKVSYYSKSGETCIILIKNIDLLCRKSLFSKSLLGHLIAFLNELDKLTHVLVVATTNKLDDVDIQLRKHSTFEDELELMAPDSAEREQILLQILRHCEIPCDECTIKNVAKWTPGFVGADLKLLVIEAALAVYKFKALSSQSFRGNRLTENCFRRGLTRVTPSGLRGVSALCVPQEDVSFIQIGGLEKVKSILDLAVTKQLEGTGNFKRLGVTPAKGILLYGPPGCAKTTLVKALAKECHATFLATSAAELYSPYVGDAEKKVVRLFNQAKFGSPAIIFIDEIDAIVGNREGAGECSVQERILSTLLVEMDGLEASARARITQGFHSGIEENSKRALATDGIITVVVIGATNNPKALDSALTRPGRFDKLLYVPPPDLEERLSILEKLTTNMSLDLSVDLKRLAELTDFFSGADLKNLCRESGLYALQSTNIAAQKIHQCHFEHVIKNLRPSLNEKIISSYESYKKLIFH